MAKETARVLLVVVPLGVIMQSQFTRGSAGSLSTEIFSKIDLDPSPTGAIRSDPQLASLVPFP